MSEPKTIVAAVDFSPTSRFALEHALRIAAASGRRVHAVHVIDTVVAIEIGHQLSDYHVRLRESLVDDARLAWAEFRSTVPGAEELPIDVVVDSRARAIMRLAASHAAELLVLGAVGERRPDVGLGTVASTCARHAHCDVLLVRDTQKGPFQRVLVGVDFSPASAKALERATELARFHEAQLHVLHTFDAPWHRLHYRSATPLTAPAEQAQFRAVLERRLADFAQPAARALGAARMRTELVEAPRHRSGIVAHAETIGADLIVVGTRGHSNLRDFLLGSTAEKVLVESRCSVLAVRA